MTEFTSWKEREEDATYTTYVKNQQAYKPSSSGEFLVLLSIPVNIILLVYWQTEIKTRHYFVCCRSGKHRINKHQRKTKEVRPHQKESRKLDSTCISRLYVDEYGDGHICHIYFSTYPWAGSWWAQALATPSEHQTRGSNEDKPWSSNWENFRR